MLRRLRFITLATAFLAGSILSTAQLWPECAEKSTQKMACCAEMSTPMECCQHEATPCPMMKAAPVVEQALVPQKPTVSFIVFATPLIVEQQSLLPQTSLLHLIQKPSGPTLCYRAGPPLRAPPSILA